MIKNTMLSRINEKERFSSFFNNIPWLNKATLSTILKKNGPALNYWVQRLVNTGEIIPLKRGLFISRNYLLKVKGQPPLFDKYREYMSQLLRTPSYISLEYALAKYGIVPDVPFAITSITNKTSRMFANEFGTFIFRNFKNSLFCGYREKSFDDKRYYFATPAKALFDFVYLRKFNRKSFEEDVESGLRINWEVFTKTDVKELKNYVNMSGKKKMKRFLDFIIRRKLV